MMETVKEVSLLNSDFLCKIVHMKFETFLTLYDSEGQDLKKSRDIWRLWRMTPHSKWGR